MTNQDAIRWLENLKNDIGNPHYERLWPYAQAIDEIMELLEEQEARVVTTADFENNPNLDDSNHLNVWEEYRDGTRCGWNTININDVITFTYIRRYWTSRPTEEQRKAVKWDE